jgi:PAS domain S-box-containing protein
MRNSDANEDSSRKSNSCRGLTSPAQQVPAAVEEEVRLKGSIVEQGFSAVLIADADLPDPKVVYINPAFSAATGYDSVAVVGQRLSSLTALQGVRERLLSGVPKGQPFIEESVPYQTPKAEYWGEWRVGPVRDEKGRITHWLFIFRDITERKKLEKEILEISDHERRRIGQDLHDGLCQHLAGIELMSQVLEQSLVPRNKRAAARAGEIARHVRDAISQTRLLARGLSPVTVESEGLMSGLKELASNTEKLFHVRCSLHCEEPVLVGDLARSTHLYRITQEAVSNAIKHGKATEIGIELMLNGGEVELKVRDNGEGFPEQPGPQGMGLRIMQYRARVLRGRISFHPNSPRGVEVRCSAPLSG